MRTHLVLRVRLALLFLFFALRLFPLGQEAPVTFELLDVHFLLTELVLKLGLGTLCGEQLALD